MKHRLFSMCVYIANAWTPTNRTLEHIKRMEKMKNGHTNEGKRCQKRIFLSKFIQHCKLGYVADFSEKFIQILLPFLLQVNWWHIPKGRGDKKARAKNKPKWDNCIRMISMEDVFDGACDIWVKRTRKKGTKIHSFASPALQSTTKSAFTSLSMLFACFIHLWLLLFFRRILFYSTD